MNLYMTNSGQSEHPVTRDSNNLLITDKMLIPIILYVWTRKGCPSVWKYN